MKHRALWEISTARKELVADKTATCSEALQHNVLPLLYNLIRTGNIPGLLGGLMSFSSVLHFRAASLIAYPPGLKRA